MITLGKKKGNKAVISSVTPAQRKHTDADANCQTLLSSTRAQILEQMNSEIITQGKEAKS